MHHKQTTYQQIPRKNKDISTYNSHNYDTDPYRHEHTTARSTSLTTYTTR
jgi:hypothetical protein